MKTIEIDDEVYQELHKRENFFGETANDVLRRILEIDEVHEEQRETEVRRKTEDKYERPIEEMISSLGLESKMKSENIRVHGATPEKEYRIPILDALVEMGGKGKAKEVLEILKEKMKDHLKNVDFERIKSGNVRWENKACWERKDMVSDGLLRSDSRHGIWEITEEGRDYLMRYKNNL